MENTEDFVGKFHNQYSIFECDVAGINQVQIAIMSKNSTK